METTPVLPENQHRRKMSLLFLAAGVVLFVVAFLVGVSDNPPGILSLFAGFFAIMLGILYWQVKPRKLTPAQQLLYWAPRALCIAFALFISLFALDVFNEEQGFWSTILALMMHLIPTFVILIVLAMSWRREWIGGILFMVLGAAYVVWAWNKPFGVWSTLLLIAGPLVLTGVLFLLNWQQREKVHVGLPR